MMESTEESSLMGLIELAWPFIKAEFRKVRQLPDDVHAIKNERLCEMKQYLMKMESKADSSTAEADGELKKKVRTAAEIVYRFEDVVDEYELLHRQKNEDVAAAGKQNQEDDAQNDKNGRSKLTSLLWGSFRRAFQYAVQLKKEHDIASSIKKIEEDKRKLMGNEESGISQKTQQQIAASANKQEPAEEDDDEKEETELLVGIDGPKENVMSLLDLGKDKHPERYFIGVTSDKPGTGKTTLVRTVFEDAEVVKHFPLRAWVTVSSRAPDNKSIVVLKKICKQFLQGKDDKLLEQVERSQETKFIIIQLNKYLGQNKMRYIVVLDDVWDEHLSEIMKALPSIGEGERILMTSRKSNVVAHWKSSSSSGIKYSLNPLSAEYAEVLLCNKIFGKNNACPDDLQKISREITEKCGRLPLVVLTVAGLLSTKNEEYHEWKTVSDELSYQLRHHGPYYDKMKRILMYSYQELPYMLKLCFLYFGIFPEDYAVDISRLFRLWAAEGFLESEGKDQTLDEIAELQLKELYQRGLVEFTTTDKTWGKEKAVKVHDMFHEIISSKLQELSFCQILKNDFVINEQSRRLSISDISGIRYENGGVGKYGYSLRCILSSEGETFPDSVTSSLQKVARGLRVLDLESAGISHIPEEVASLQHLRLLSLRGTKVQTLPKSIGLLWYLQTLDLRESKVKELPREVNCLHNLAHLLLNLEITFQKGVHLGKLIALQTLIDVDASTPGLFDELKSLRRLRKLRIISLLIKHRIDLCHAVQKLPELRSLDAVWTSNTPSTAIEYPVCDPLGRKKLQRLSLCVTLQNLPFCIEDLHNLVSLYLSLEHLSNDHLRVLEKLSSLSTLEISARSCDKSLDFGSKGFKVLRFLYIYSSSPISKRKKLKPIAGTLPQLRKLVLLDRSPAQNVEIIPSTLQEKTVFLQESDMKWHSPLCLSAFL